MPANRGIAWREGLEVEVAHRGLQPRERAGNVAVHRRPALANCLTDNVLKPGQCKVLGNIPNLFDPCGFQLLPTPSSEPGSSSMP